MINYKNKLIHICEKLWINKLNINADIQLNWIVSIDES